MTHQPINRELRILTQAKNSLNCKRDVNDYLRDMKFEPGVNNNCE